MDTKSMIRQLEQERDRIDNALFALRALDGIDQMIAAKAKTAPAKVAAAKVGRPKKRRLSAAGRAKIAAAAKARWARVHAIAEAGKAKKK